MPYPHRLITVQYHLNSENRTTGLKSGIALQNVEGIQSHASSYIIAIATVIQGLVSACLVTWTDRQIDWQYLYLTVNALNRFQRLADF